MARLKLSKSELNRQGKQLKTFKQFLPSLDLKRRQLMGERAKAVAAVRKTEEEIAELEQAVGRELLMLSNENVDLTDIVRVTGYDIAEENVVGTRLPVLRSIDVEVRPYGFLTRPHWVDRLVEYLKRALELRIRLQVEHHRVERLERAVKTVTQRVNLFEKVLIPGAQNHIKRIKIYLSDVERAAVVNAKIAKRKHA
jgi:V/A-type H+-transporting ATPase subunit D